MVFNIHSFVAVISINFRTLSSSVKITLYLLAVTLHFSPNPSNP